MSLDDQTVEETVPLIVEEFVMLESLISRERMQQRTAEPLAVNNDRDSAGVCML